MKLTTANIAVIMVALVGISAASTYALSAEMDVLGKPTGNGAMMMTGNVMVTQFDGDGNTVAFRQSDNHIVGQGMEMIISQMFKGMNGTADANSQPVSHMEIGHRGEWELLMNDTDLREPADDTIGACVRVAASFANVTNGLPTGDGFGRATIMTGVQGGLHTPCEIGQWAGELGGAGSATCAAQANVTAQAQFTGALCNGALTIDEAGMFNDAAAGTMFARNNFGGVVLNAPDTLQLDWEFTFTDS
jgi:hypothetical protein